MDSDDERRAAVAPSRSTSPGSSEAPASSDDERNNNNLLRASPSASSQHPLTGSEQVSRATSPSQLNGDSAAALSNYLSAVQQRRALYATPPVTSSTAYSIQSIFTIPQSTHSHALALPPCCSHLYSGGADGFIRRYAFFPTLNGNGQDNPAFPNMTMKQGGHAPPPGTDMRQPALVSYWENEEPGEWSNDMLAGHTGNDKLVREAKVKWGPKNAALGPQSAVYSLAVQREELWGLSGTAQGTINLYTIRHDEGQIRHVFRASDAPTAGHRSKTPVSVLTLGDEETSVLSGGWDGRILQWDLNTGAASRDYTAHLSQVSSIAYRPVSAPTTNGFATTEDTEMGEAEPSTRVRTDEVGAPAVNGDAAALTSPLSSSSSSNGVAAALVQPTTGAETSGVPAVAPIDQNGTIDLTLDDGVDSDADADGEEIDEDALMTFPLPTTSTGTPIPIATSTGAPATAAPIQINGTGQPVASSLPPRPNPMNKVPVVGPSSGLPVLSSDVFMSTSIEGQVVIWDRRIKNGDKGGVRRLDHGSKHAGWCASASWSPDGQQIYVGRRSSAVEIYDVRQTSPLQTLRLPASTGTVSSVLAMPSGRHLITASEDNIRLWNLDLVKGSETRRSPAFTVIPGHHGGVVSQLYLDPLSKYLVSASGNRGWEGSSTESIVIHEVKVV